MTVLGKILIPVVSRPHFQRNNANIIMQENYVFYTQKILGDTVKGRILNRRCAYQEVRNVRFSETLACFLYL